MGTDLESIFPETLPADTLQLALETLHIKVFTTVFAINPTSNPLAGLTSSRIVSSVLLIPKVLCLFLFEFLYVVATW